MSQNPVVQKYLRELAKQGGEALKEQKKGTDYYKNLSKQGVKARLAKNAKKAAARAKRLEKNNKYNYEQSNTQSETISGADSTK